MDYDLNMMQKQMTRTKLLDLVTHSASMYNAYERIFVVFGRNATKEQKLIIDEIVDIIYG
jgi:hypothetical protein